MFSEITNVHRSSMRLHMVLLRWAQQPASDKGAAVHFKLISPLEVLTHPGVTSKFAQTVIAVRLWTPQSVDGDAFANGGDSDTTVNASAVF